MQRFVPLMLLLFLPLALGATGLATKATDSERLGGIEPTAAGGALLDDADAAAQRATLGLGSLATQNAGSLAVTGGSISGITDVAIADGGTGASTAANARSNLDIVVFERTTAGLFSPADNLPYYFGRPSLAPTVSEGLGKLYFPFDCTIKAATVCTNTTGTLASNETFTVSIRKNGSNDTTISSAVTCDAANRVFRNDSMNLSLTANDYVEFKAVTPTWTTNPTNTVWTVVLEIAR